MNLLQAINAHALAAAQSGDWEAVAATLRALTETAPARKCSSSETVAALQQAGLNATAILTLLETDVNGRFLLNMLASQGVIWNHPLTVPYIQGVLSSQAVTVLRNLSAPVTTLFPSVTADDCRDAFVGAAIVSRITNAAALANERMLPTDTAQQLAAKWAQVWAEAV